MNETRKCTLFPVKVSYCRDILESKNMSGVYHNFNPTRPCVRCSETPTDFKTGVIDAPRNFETISRKRSEVVEILKSETSVSSTASKSILVKEAKKLLQGILISHWFSFFVSRGLYIHS